MIINKSSWHYRLVESTVHTPSESLCVYFWMVVGAAFIRLTLCGLAVLIIVGSTFALVNTLYSISTNTVNLSTIPAILFTIIILVVLLGAAREVYSKRVEEEYPLPFYLKNITPWTVPTYRVNILKEFIKAKITKVYPRIHFI